MSAESIAATQASLTPPLQGDELLAWVNGHDTTRAARVIGEAIALVGEHLGRATTVDLVPGAILRRAVLAVAGELYHAQDAPAGVDQWATEGVPAAPRRPRDPLVPARPLLARYVGGGFA